MASIYDVARRAAVSPATVSRVLNDRKNVNLQMAERVQHAIAELGYRPNSVTGGSWQPNVPLDWTIDF